MNHISGSILVAGLALLTGVACSGEESGSRAKPATAAAPAPAAAPAKTAAGPGAVAEAKQIFATRCTTCHGAAGAGDGPASAGLTPRPRNFQDADWQGSVTDDHLEKIILYGGAAVARSPAMPGNPDLAAKPEVVAALRQHIRDLAR